MSRVYAVRSRPDISRPQIPGLNLAAYWDHTSGLYVSLHGSAVNSNVADSPRPAPTFLEDDEIWKAFMPIRARNQGPLFGRLNITDRDLRKLISYKNGKHLLDEDVGKSWFLLEHLLFQILEFLYHHHSNVSSKRLSFPQLPHQCGYRRYHRTKRDAFWCAKKSREAFTPLSALLTFFLSFSMTSDEQEPFDTAFHQLHEKTNPISIQSLTYLEQSYVCDISPHTRNGCFLNPYTTEWSQFFGKFVMARVGIWLIWGHEDVDAGLVKDKNILKHYPPSDVLARAKKRFLAASGIRQAEAQRVLSLLQNSNVLHQSSDSGTPSTELYAAYGAPLDKSCLYREAELQEYTTSGGRVEKSSYVLPSMFVEPGSLQLPGEDWRDFFKRMEKKRERDISRESPAERSTRLNNEVVSQKTGSYTRKSRVYIWKCTQSGFWYRSMVKRVDVEFEWDSVTEHQRRFMSHLNQWDLCPQMEAYPPGTVEPRIEDMYDYDEENFSFLDSEPGKQSLLPSPPAPGEFSLLNAARTLLDSICMFKDSPSFGFDEHLLYRHGFSARSHAISPVLSDAKRAASSMDDVLKYMQWSPKYSSSNVEATAYINFFNILRQEDLSRHDLPRSCDISSQNSNTLSLDQLRFSLRRYSSGDQETYVITPPTNSSDPCDWVIGTPSARTVLHIYRSQWRTMHDVAKGLLAAGAKFFTFLPVSPIASPHAFEAVPENPQGLGYRSDTYEHTLEDLEGYLLRLKDLMTSPAGRALRLHGGIVG